MGPALASTPSSPADPLTALAEQEVAHYADQLPPGTVVDCTAPAGNPAPGTLAWELRDLENQLCATGRLTDEYLNPAFASAFNEQAPAMYLDQTLSMLGSPGHLHLSLGQLLPGGTTADPFRTIARWTSAGRGRVVPVSFDASDGAQLNGYVFEPPRNGHYPGVVITTGSIQGYQQLYFWAAEGLAEAGYMVMTYDVQGQGDSDTLPASCSLTSCPGVPFQQNYNFYQGTEDALNFFFSTPAHPYANHGSGGLLGTLGVHLNPYNPVWASLDRSEVGIAGHSLGASAVSQDGQCDPRVKAIVAWDNLAPATPCSGSGPVHVRVPALGINSEYFLNPEPMTSVPDPHAKDQAFQQLKGAGIDTMQVALRSSTHLEYSYVPLILPASALGERVAFYYTLAWFDYYLRHEASGYQRLIATTFNSSADVHSIGTGSYDGSVGNVPPKIADLPVADLVSFYYESEYSLSPPGPGGGPDRSGPKKVCVDMRAGCPAKAPPTP